MRIAINTRFANYGYVEGYGRFTAEMSHRIAMSCPQDSFIFVHDRPPSADVKDPENVKRFTIGPPARHPLLWKYWYDVRVPLLLKRQRADIFFSPDGICSLTTRVPQLLAIHDLAFLHHPETMPRLQQRFYAGYTPRFIEKASRILTVSEFSRQDIIRHYPAAKGKVDVVPNAADPSFLPVSAEQAYDWKEVFSEGREYFLCLGSIHPRKNLINLLKAFSIFKKRQRTNMLLVIAGRKAWKHDEFTRALSGFKYRHDVRLTGYVPRHQLQILLGSAYALVYPSLWEGFGMPVLEAMQSGIPVLWSDNTSMPEVAGDAALYFDPLQPEQMASQMSLVFKDERERSRRILLGLERAKAFDWERSARLVREIIAGTALAGINA
jgi:glycosyltransferase involved in cell wall biosynthesis